MLLGKLLVRKHAGAELIGRIVETEAYFGLHDPAAHAFTGRTPRVEVLFGPPGHAYVYFTYGLHHCLNVSCEPEGQAGCVLIRALEPLAGLPEMAANRGLNGMPGELKLLASGPGRLCQALGLTRGRHNGMDLTAPDSELRILEDGFLPAAIEVTTRIGVSKAADRPLRFMVAGNGCVSRGKHLRLDREASPTLR